MLQFITNYLNQFFQIDHNDLIIENKLLLSQKDSASLESVIIL
jgi:hypothetical protein